MYLATKKKDYVLEQNRTRASNLPCCTLPEFNVAGWFRGTRRRRVEVCLFVLKGMEKVGDFDTVQNSIRQTQSKKEELVLANKEARKLD